jgi:hypothetical protein
VKRLSLYAALPLVLAVAGVAYGDIVVQNAPAD